MEKLQWRDKFVAKLVQELSAYNEADCLGKTPLVISGDNNIVILKVSLDEWTKLYSSLFTGADICYPDESDNVRWILNRAVECPVEICEMMIDCIENDFDVQRAIIDMIMGDEIFNQYLETKIDTLTTGQITGKLIQGECDRPVLAGKIKALVDAMDQANKDWFEKIEVGTNDEEKFALAIEAIPILGELPIDQIIEFGEDILEDFTENYNAQVDAELLQEWYCGLLCVAEKNDDCSISYGEIYDYFAERTSSGLNPLSALGDVIGFIRNGDFSGGTRVADGMMMLQTGLTVNGREFMGSSLPTIAFATRDAPTATYYEDCDDCPVEYEWIEPGANTLDYQIEVISSTETEYIADLIIRFTGNYSMFEAVAVDDVPFYIASVESVVGLFPDGSIKFAGGTYGLDNVPCDVEGVSIGIQTFAGSGPKPQPGDTLRVTLSREPCSTDIWNVVEGVKTGETETTASFETVEVEPGQWMLIAATIDGWGWDMNSTDWDAPPVSITWKDEGGSNHFGVPPAGTPITYITIEFDEYSAIIMEGTRVQF